MKKTIILLFLIAGISSFGTTVDTLQANSSISNVTVYFSGAEVNRITKPINLTSGKNYIEITDLPLNIDENTVQVLDINGFEVSSVKYEKVIQNNFSGKEKKFIDQLKGEEIKIKKLNNLLRAYAVQEEMILRNQSFGNSKGTSISQVKEAADFFQERLLRINNSKLKCQLEIDSIYDYMNEIKLKVLKDNKRKAYGRILISIDCEKPITRKLMVSYFAHLASWTPMYDFKATDLESPISIVHKAKVAQSTGENWSDAQITLSTGNPNANATKPELKPWDILSSNRYDQHQNNLGSSGIELTILDDKGHPIPSAEVSVYKANEIIFYQRNIPENGVLKIYPLPPGAYKVSINVLGKNPIDLMAYTKKNIISRYTRVPQNIVRKGELVLDDPYKLNEVALVWDKPLIEKGKTSEIRTQAEIRNLPIRSQAQLSSGDVVYGYQAPSSTEHKKTYNVSLELKPKTTRIEYALEKKNSINSNGDENVITLFTQKVDCNFIHYTVPKIENEVYLTASIPGFSKLNLQKGITNLYFEKSFIGQTFIDPSTVNDTLIISLGRDNNVLSARKTTSESFNKSTFGSTKKVTLGYEIEVRNNRATPIKLVIQDQIPLEVNEDIHVEIIDKSNAKVQPGTGILEWELELNPEESKKVINRFKIEFPSNVNLNFN